MSGHNAQCITTKMELDDNSGPLTCTKYQYTAFSCPGLCIVCVSSVLLMIEAPSNTPANNHQKCFSFLTTITHHVKNKMVITSKGGNSHTHCTCTRDRGQDGG